MPRRVKLAIVNRLETAEATRFESIGLRYAKLRVWTIRMLLRLLDPAGPWKEPFPSWR